jgi:hypothetical protein
MRCFACNEEIAVRAPERVGFRDTCPRCGADLHVCRNCAHHDPAAHNQCREPNAEWVADRERANRCEWFAPGERAGGAAARPAGSARAALDALFKKR